MSGAPRSNLRAPKGPGARLKALQRKVVGHLFERAVTSAARLGRRTAWAQRRLSKLKVTRDVAYGPMTPEGRSPTPKGWHLLDVYEPPAVTSPDGGPNPLRPALLYIHGGGFRILSKDTHWSLALSFSEAGYVVFNINYRLSPEHPCPAGLEDCARALEWIWDHAEEYGADPRNLSVAGESAGGNLSVALALGLSRPIQTSWGASLFERAERENRHFTALMPSCGFHEVARASERLRGQVHPFILGRIELLAGAYLRGSDHPALAEPLNELEALAQAQGSRELDALQPFARPMPPCFVTVGARDPIAPQSARLHVALQGCGVESHFESYPRQGHAFHALLWRAQAKRCWRDHIAFLKPLTSALLALICFGLSSLSSLSAQAAPHRLSKSLIAHYKLQTIGDQSNLLLSYRNPSATPYSLFLGHQDGSGITKRLEGYAEVQFVLQCKRPTNESEPLPLSFLVNGEDLLLPHFGTSHQDLRGSLWVQSKSYSSPPRGAVSTLKRSPKRVKAKDLPEHFSSLTSVDLVMMSLETLSSLSVAQRETLKASVASGATLIVDLERIGRGAKGKALLSEFSSVEFGEIIRDEQLSSSLPSPTYRRLFLSREVNILLKLKGSPLVVESAYGMGRVRVSAIPLKSIPSGPIAERVFAVDHTASQQLSRWLRTSTPPLSMAPRLFNHRLWALVGLIPLLGLVTRRRLSLLVLSAGGWVTVALLYSPLPPSASISAARTLYLPLEQGSISIGSLDISSSERGTHVIPLSPRPLSLLSAESTSVCLIQELESDASSGALQINRPLKAMWVLLNGEIGERARVSYLAPQGDPPRDHPTREGLTLPSWPEGPWSEARLAPLQPLPTDYPLGLYQADLRAWRTPASPQPRSEPPLVLN